MLVPHTHRGEEGLDDEMLEVMRSMRLSGGVPAGPWSVDIPLPGVVPLHFSRRSRKIIVL